MWHNSKNGQPEADRDQEAMLVRQLLAAACGNYGLDLSAPDLPDRIVVVREITWDTTADDLLEAFRHIGVIQAATADQEMHTGLVVFCCHAAAVQAIRQPVERWSELRFDCCEPAPAAIVPSTSCSGTSTSDDEVCLHLLSAAVLSVLAPLTPEFLAERWTATGLGAEESATSVEGGPRSFLEHFEKMGSEVSTMCAQETAEIIRGFLSTLSSSGAVHHRLLDAAVASALAPEVLTFLSDRSTGISPGPGSVTRSSPARNSPTEIMAHRRLRAAVASALASGMLKTLGTASSTAESTSATPIQGGRPLSRTDQLARPPWHGAAVRNFMHPNHLAYQHQFTCQTMALPRPYVSEMIWMQENLQHFTVLQGSYDGWMTWSPPAYLSYPTGPQGPSYGWMTQWQLPYFPHSNRPQRAYGGWMTQWQLFYLPSSMEPPVGAHWSSGMQRNLRSRNPWARFNR